MRDPAVRMSTITLTSGTPGVVSPTKGSATASGYAPVVAHAAITVRPTLGSATASGWDPSIEAPLATLGVKIEDTLSLGLTIED